MNINKQIKELNNHISTCPQLNNQLSRGLYASITYFTSSNKFKIVGITGIQIFKMNQ